MPGPFFFAWVANDEVDFDPALHAVEDLQIFSFTISHQEGNFPTLNIVVRNPRIGLLAPGRPLWAYLSWSGGAGGLTPLFFGRLVGLPGDLIQEVVDFKFIDISIIKSIQSCISHEFPEPFLNWNISSE